MSEETFDAKIQHVNTSQSTVIATVDAATIGTPERFSAWLSGILGGIQPKMTVKTSSAGGRELLEAVRNKPYDIVCAELRCEVRCNGKVLRYDNYYITLEEKEN